MRAILLLLILAFTQLVWADNSSKNLQQIQQQIQRLQTNLQQSQSTRANLQTSLQSIETAIGKANNQLHQTQIELQQQHAILQKLNNQQLQYEAALSQQQATLANQLRAAYILGHQQYFKLLLSQQDPARISRLMTYYRYLMNNKVQVITQLNQLLQQLAANKEQIEQHNQQLAALQAKQQKESLALQGKKTAREQVLKNLDSEIQSKHLRLRELQANKQALESIVKRLFFAHSKSFRLPPGKSFAQLRGRLPWPTLGKITEGFDTQIDQSELKLSGVIISAAEGQNVYAVAPGHVVFANWMPGYGLLLIIDHGQGYMTLYGRNDALYKKNGDNVAAGELIATVGHSGGYTKPGLYFAIRQDGIAVDPKRWCG